MVQAKEEQAVSENELRESEEKYRTLVERANDGIIIVQDGIIQYANPRMAELDGSSVEHLVGSTYMEHVYPSEVPKIIEIYRRRMKGERIPTSYETLLRRMNGEAASAEISASVVNYRGRPADLVIIHDISKYKLTESGLRQKEAEFRTLAENSPDIILRYNGNGRFLYANPKAEPVFRHPPSQLIGKNIDDLGLPAQGVEFWKSLIREVFSAKKEKIIEFSFPPGERYFNAHLVPEYDEKGEVSSMLAISRDVTEMKRNEEILRRNEYELRSLSDNSPDLILRIDSRLRYEYVNTAYERLTGIPKDQFIGKTNRELGMQLQLVESWEKALAKVIESGREHAMEFEISSLFGKRYFATRLIPEFVRSGQVETVLVIARDITERVRAEEQLRYISFHDKVTALFNRAFFEEEIRRIDTERELPISIIMGDVNFLKLSNDVFGHEEGDRLLRTIAGMIRAACRRNDIVARWGGDEFAAILPRTEYATADDICRRIQQMGAGQEETVIRPSIALGVATKDHREQNIYQVIRQAEERMYDNKMAGSKRNEQEILFCLMARARERTQDLTTHIEQARILVRRFGEALSFDEDQMKNLLLLVDLHDIGMATVPRTILTKPGRLTQEEWSHVKRHSEAGYRIIKSFPDTARIADEVLAHDEWWDGTGYPRGLRGKEIPYLARVFALVEAYDVMTHPRRYARTLTPAEAVEELHRSAGRQFDPELVSVFLDKVIAREPVRV